MFNVLRKIKEELLIFDGPGQYLLKKGNNKYYCPEILNIEDTNTVRHVLEKFREAAVDIVLTNTFEANRIRLKQKGYDSKITEINTEAVRIVRETLGRKSFVAGLVGSTGRLLKPHGELSFEEAYEVFYEQIKILYDSGVDLFFFGSFSDLSELRVAILALKDISNSVPVICSMKYEYDEKTLTGTDPYTAGIILKSLGVDVIGFDAYTEYVRVLNTAEKIGNVGGIYKSINFIESLNGEYSDRASLTDSIILECIEKIIFNNFRMIGGIAGFGKEFIEIVKEKFYKVQGEGNNKKINNNEAEYVIASPVNALRIDNNFRVGNSIYVNECVSKCKKKTLDIDNNCDDLYNAVYLDLRNNKKKKDEVFNLVNTLQYNMSKPVVLEADDPSVLEDALRIYMGKAGVVINTKKAENLYDFVKLAKKYGSTLVDKEYIRRVGMYEDNAGQL